MRGARTRFGGIVASVVTAVAVGATVSGCSLLFPFGELGPGEFEEPEPLATYATGSARLELEDGTSVVLDEISEGPHLFTEFGGQVGWLNDDGWGLQLMLYEEGFGGELDDAFVTLHRIRDAHWTTMDDTGCSLDIEQADEEGLRGSGRCIDLEWVDMLRGGMSFEGHPKPIEGQEPFDVEIKFEASP